MKTACLLLLGVALAGTPGCTTFPTDRIASHQADFNAWPPEVQAQVRAGQVGAGFTPEQVWIALGEPSAKTQAGGPGSLTEVWVYHRRAPRFSIGIGGGGYSGNTAVGGSVSANGLKLGLDVDGRVLFFNGRVTEVEITTR
jgi:hypothetical protein